MKPDTYIEDIDIKNHAVKGDGESHGHDQVHVDLKTELFIKYLKKK